MASLTPGVLSKLLENAGNKVTGEHRHALLQVTEIVPRLSEEPWQSRGYFLKLSDSLHSAYVSVSDEDTELICVDKLQLGQFVYVTRLDSASPVPVVRGLNPLPKRRPCIGNPIDLVSGDSLHVATTTSNVHFTRPKKGNNKSNTKTSTSTSSNNGSSSSGLKKRDDLKRGSPPSKGNRVVEEGLEMRRLSLDSARRVWDHGTPVAAKRGSSSVSSGLRSKLKSTSTSPKVIEKKISLKTDSPLKSPTSSVSPLKNKNENLCPKLTSTPPRKSTVKSPCAGTVPSQLVKVPLNFKTWYDTFASWKDLPPPMCNLGKQVVTHRNVAFLAAVRSLEEASATDTVIQSMCMFAELCQSCQTLSAGLLVKQFLELHLSLQRATIVFDSLLAPPGTKPSSHSTLQCLVEDSCTVPTRKNAMSWVQAAIDTNLSKFNLFRTQAKSEVVDGEKCHFVVINNEEMNTEDFSAQNKQNCVIQAALLPNSAAKKRLPSSKRNLLVTKNKDTDKQDQSKESELRVAASLAEKLRVASREWFLRYLEESLSNEFGLKSEEGNTEIACLLGQLKKVNHWLDNLVVGDKVDHRVESLRKSLFRFLLDHVNSAVASRQ
ncbi:uncharacterized protein LOC133307445 [Gastrolobium bilobum]|uniref:uncharacterized protein LOC133307445 n=1 Tax=Gastrolobium bilobum TaxID=150636 RepID=UPI002AB1071D|nr:uncharacterized protein LOC133307445 [Gastrolobium bilobum]